MKLTMVLKDRAILQFADYGSQVPRRESINFTITIEYYYYKNIYNLF